MPLPKEETTPPVTKMYLVSTVPLSYGLRASRVRCRSAIWVQRYEKFFNSHTLIPFLMSNTQRKCG